MLQLFQVKADRVVPLQYFSSHSVGVTAGCWTLTEDLTETDIMPKASSSLLLLLLTLSLNVQLPLSAPTTVGVFQSSVVAEEPYPGLAEEAPVPVIPVQTSEDGPEESTAVEELDVENASPEQDDVVYTDPTASIPTIPAEDENTDIEAAPEELLIIPDDLADEEPDASQESVFAAPGEEKSDVVHVQPEIEDAVQEESVGKETAPEEPAVLILMKPSEEDPEEEENIPVFSSEATIEDAPEKPVEEAEVVPIFLEKNAEEEPVINEEPEEKSAALLPLEQEDYDDDAAEDHPEHPVVLVTIPIESEKNDEEDRTRQNRKFRRKQHNKNRPQ
ncbi:uncharacterized protein LOC115044056 [Echeneis naucrates]|uniref:uncharacterized protein LOC115044056 n=1 Tax=Echeneis naucrates TaxID=173247 RepID=UPI0011143F70|nr:uncharacterized protein LOC115044056 [Echeneis naucrates]